jgi:hypothetical protein
MFISTPQIHDGIVYSPSPARLSTAKTSLGASYDVKIGTLQHPGHRRSPPFGSQARLPAPRLHLDPSSRSFLFRSESCTAPVPCCGTMIMPGVRRSNVASARISSSPLQFLRLRNIVVVLFVVATVWTPVEGKSKPLSVV